MLAQSGKPSAPFSALLATQQLSPSFNRCLKRLRLQYLRLGVEYSYSLASRGLTCANSGMQLAMLADMQRKRYGQRGGIIAAPRVILCKFSSFRSKIARLPYRNFCNLTENSMHSSPIFCSTTSYLEAKVFEAASPPVPSKVVELLNVLQASFRKPLHTFHIHLNGMLLAIRDIIHLLTYT